MTLEDLGFNPKILEYQKEHNLDAFGIGRVTSEHKDRYTVKTEKSEFDSEVIGNLRFSANSRYDLPAVGDWVAISEYDADKALIHAILPRKSIVERKAVGKHGQTQIIATNIDVGLIVQSINRDFSINRLERYLTICNASKIDAVIVLTKVDLINDEEVKRLLNQVKLRIKQTPIYTISNETQNGIEDLKSILIKGKTYCLLGSSGVGKSTLINSLTGIELMKTGSISSAIDRGKHVTSHRELIVFENGILIDNPGMREVGITHNSEGIEMTFDEILTLSQQCKFNDCSHISEKGCAILAALEAETLDPDSYENFIKMEKEKEHFEADVHQRRKKDKAFGKMIKQTLKAKKTTKYRG